MKSILLSLLLVSSTAVLATEAEVKAEVSYRDQIVLQAEQFVERTVNLIATPFLSDKDVECMAKNIFYEAGGESREGKIAVAQVTLNRAQDPRFGKTVCEVVSARTTVVKNKQIEKTELVKVGFFGRPEQVTKTEMVSKPVTVCQFSWMCGSARKPKADDERWVESKEIAQAIARGELQQERSKYSSAMYFHAAGIRPAWAKSKTYLKRTGHHIFYGEVDK